MVAILILNYNSSEDTIECLESVLKLEGAEFKVFIVDNSSEQSHLRKIMQWAEGEENNLKTSFKELVYPLVTKPISYQYFTEGEKIIEKDCKIIFIRANKNRGFAAGNNIALRHIKENIHYSNVWLLNNDTVVEKGALAELVKKSSNTNGIIGSLLFYYSNPTILQGLGGNFNKWFGTSKPIKNGAKLKDVTGQEIIDYPIGASMLVTQDFLLKIGLMDESYFLYYEEIDWVLRGQKLGFRTTFSKKSIVYHKVGTSIGSGKGLIRSEFSDYYTLKNRLKITKKFYPKFLFTTYIGFLMVIFNRLRRRQFIYAINAIRIMLNLPVSKFKKPQ